MEVVPVIFGILFVILVVFALYMIGIGLLGLLLRRPFAFSGRILAWFILMFLTALFMSAIAMLVDEVVFWASEKDIGSMLASFPSFLADHGLSSLMLIFVPLFLWVIYGRPISGYWVSAANERDIRRALIYALSKLELPFQETVSRIRLTSLDADLKANPVYGMGIAKIWIQPSRYRQQSKEIAAAANEYYKINTKMVPKTTSISYIIFGIFILVGSIPFAFYFMMVFFYFLGLFL
jgi:hypothetical protein